MTAFVTSRCSCIQRSVEGSAYRLSTGTEKKPEEVSAHIEMRVVVVIALYLRGMEVHCDNMIHALCCPD